MRRLQRIAVAWQLLLVSFALGSPPAASNDLTTVQIPTPTTYVYGNTRLVIKNAPTAVVIPAQQAASPAAEESEDGSVTYTQVCKYSHSVPSRSIALYGSDDSILPFPRLPPHKQRLLLPWESNCPERLPLGGCGHCRLYRNFACQPPKWKLGHDARNPGALSSCRLAPFKESDWAIVTAWRGHLKHAFRAAARD